MESGEEKKSVSPDDEVHIIDGIVELNHPAPFWWQMIYYASIVWAIGYMIYYLGGEGLSSKEALRLDLAKIESGRVTQQVSGDEETNLLLSAFKSPEKLEMGEKVYQKSCSSCHAPDGGGGIGPNLSDSSWIHGDGSVMGIFKTVREGVADKGMPPWGAILKPEEVVSVSAYVRSLRGKATAKPKLPEGEAITLKEES